MKWYSPLAQMVFKAQKVARQRKIPCLLVGGLAASLWGIQRLTYDVDVIMALAPKDLEGLLDALIKEGFQAPARTPSPASGMFDILKLTYKFRQRDFILDILYGEHPFLKQMFQRGVQTRVSGIGNINFISAEDSMLMKLIAGRKKDMFDCLDILKTVDDGMDFKYLEHWIKALKLRNKWERIKVYWKKER